MQEVMHTFRCSEVNDVSILFEHIDLLNRLNWLDVELLQRRLQLLVVCARGLVHLLYLSPRSAFTSVENIMSAMTLHVVVLYRPRELCS